MDGYQRRTEMKKSQIIHAAISLFQSYGTEKVSLAEIARKAKVSPVSIYNYFGTKEQLLQAVVTHVLEEALNERRMLMRSDLPFREKIEKMIFDSIHFAGRYDPGFLRTLMSDNPAMQAIIEEITSRAWPEIRAFFEQGRAEGHLNPEVSTETMVIYIELLKDAAAKVRFYGDKQRNEQLVRELSSLFFHGLLTKS